MYFLDQLDVIAVIVGVMFTLRKLDTQSRSAAQHPNVAPEDFERWQRQTSSAYAPGAYASFFREVFHFGFVRYASNHPMSNESYRHIGLLVDFVWLAAVVSTLIRAHFARELRKKLGISLERPQPTR